jgi:deoxyribodipyrimidine photo-lyase
MNFPTVYDEIMKRVESINPLEYGKTRNHINGAVTYLSPYISRGVISTKQIQEIILDKGYTTGQTEKFIQELAWREYFQRVWQHMEDDIFDDIRHRRTGIQHRNIPTAIAEANTGIQSIDEAIRELYTTGYMHNHLRMYTASITCNIAKSNWQLPSQWMYYHLLDGDLASNACSWQWVTGNFSSRQYFCNQENINTYTNSTQQQTFLDKTYDELPGMKVPEILKSNLSLTLQTVLPEKVNPVIDTSLPLVIYTSNNLDPLWKQDIKANRILLLEPSHFKQYPVSKKVINFILDLAKNIKGIQVFTGQVNEIPELMNFPAIYSKEHPLAKHFPGMKEERDWMFPETKGFYNSFFSYWNKCLQNKHGADKKNYALAVA